MQNALVLKVCFQLLNKSYGLLLVNGIMEMWRIGKKYVMSYKQWQISYLWIWKNVYKNVK